MNKTTLCAVAVATGLLGIGPPWAHAQPSPPPSPSPQGDAAGDVTPDDARKPWAEGVSDDDRRKATELFKVGNSFLLDFNYNDAIATYRDALGYWDHPRIHYNLALALINTAEPLEIYASLEAALRWGEAAFDRKNYETALRYKTLIEGQLVRVTVSCTEEGAKVSVDGRVVGTCPMAAEQLLRSGDHAFTASKPGFETAAVSKVYPGGQTDAIELRLYRPEDLTRFKRRMPSWIPYTVLGGGAAVTGLGALLHVSARNDIDDFDAAILACGGCIPAPGLLDQRDGAATKQVFAMTAYAVGGAALVTGVTLLVLNRPQPFRAGPEAERLGAAVAPSIGNGSVGVSASFRF
jgi:hypothetical protein